MQMSHYRQVIRQAFAESLKNAQSHLASDHYSAWDNSARSEYQSNPGIERAIGLMLRGLGEYVDGYCLGDSLASDHYCGEEWLTMARALRALLNGPTGRFDCGALDSALCALYKYAGFEGEF
jgi:hypothetical protein